MLNKKGQNIAEYVILVALIIAAAAAMQVYLKRGLQGRMADAVDHAPTVQVDQSGVPTPLNFATKQYEPYYSNSASDVASTSNYADTIGNRGDITRATMGQQTQRAAGSYDRQEWDSFNAR